MIRITSLDAGDQFLSQDKATPEQTGLQTGTVLSSRFTDDLKRAIFCHIPLLTACGTMTLNLKENTRNALLIRWYGYVF